MDPELDCIDLGNLAANEDKAIVDFKGYLLNN